MDAPKNLKIKISLKQSEKPETEKQMVNLKHFLMNYLLVSASLIHQVLKICFHQFCMDFFVYMAANS